MSGCCGARDGKSVRVGPLLLDGPPSIGRTSWSHWLADIRGTLSVELDASKDLASFPLTGTACGWATAQPGRPLDAMIDERTANPPVIVDEVDKAGVSRMSFGTCLSRSPPAPGTAVSPGVPVG